MTGDRRPVVLAWPARTPQHNPFPDHVADALERAGLDVVELSLGRALLGRADVALWHWPERAVEHRSTLGAVLHVVAVALVLARLAATRTPLVVVAHNERSHLRRHPRLESVLQALVDRRVAGVVHLSQWSRELLARSRPHSAARPSLVTRHGQDVPATAGASGEPDASPRRALCFGVLKRYKGVPALLEAFAAVPGDGWRLEVRGAAAEPDLFVEVERLAARDRRVEVSGARQTDDELDAAIARATLVVLPYEAVLNSGSALHALARRRPVLVPALGSLPELQADVGEPWVRLYRPPLTPAELEAALAWAATTDRGPAPDLGPYDWAVVGAAVAGFVADRAGRRRP